MSEFTVVPGSNRCYATDAEGAPTDPPEHRPEVEQSERQRLQALVERGQEAEASITLERWRKLRETPGGGREFADDPEATPAEQRLFETLAAWRRS